MFDTNKTVIAIDDTITIQEILKKTLGQLGFEKIVTASSADEGLSALENHSDIGLIICDVNMPGKTGLELLSDIKQREILKDLPFVILTMENDLKTVNEAIALGVTGYALKPFTKESLEKSLNNAFEKHTAPPRR